MTTETDEIIKEFYEWVLTDPIKENSLSKSKRRVMGVYCNCMYPKSTFEVDNYLLIIEPEEYSYDIFSDEIVVDSNNQLQRIELMGIDTSSTEEVAFQLSTLYNFYCSTDSIEFLLKIVNLLRQKRMLYDGV